MVHRCSSVCTARYAASLHWHSRCMSGFTTCLSLSMIMVWVPQRPGEFIDFLRSCKVDLEQILFCICSYNIKSVRSSFIIHCVYLSFLTPGIVWASNSKTLPSLNLPPQKSHLHASSVNPATNCRVLYSPTSESTTAHINPFSV